MMLANVAWILASNGCRVLAVDWDLEAPGLHRYFQPFLPDKDLTDTDGLLDFVTDFAVAAMTPAEQMQQSKGTEPWYYPYADISRYATSLEWDFGSGTLDVVGAGRQGPSYSTRVNAFRWQDFYERFGGGAFLEQMKSSATARYDYVLIDSRTGVSDTSGICTIQLPQTLVVCFTLNNQSVDGAADAAASVAAKRTDMRILPVPMRIENSEKEKLDLRRSRARRRFAGVLAGKPALDSEQYWGAVEVPYVPYYAYEEILASFGDQSGSTSTMLAAAERLTDRLTSGRVKHSVRISESKRAQVLAAYEGTPVRPPRANIAIPGGYVYISYRRDDAGFAHRLFDQLTDALGPERVMIDIGSLRPGTDFVAAVEDAIRGAAVVVALIGPRWAVADGKRHLAEPLDPVRHELATALRTEDVRVIPALVGNAEFPSERDLPDDLIGIIRRQAIELSDGRWTYDVRRLIATVELAIADSTLTKSAERDPEVPYTPSDESAKVIESLLQGPRESRVRRALDRWRLHGPAIAVLVSTLIALLVAAGVVHLTAAALAAVVIAINVAGAASAWALQLAPTSEASYQQRRREGS